MPACKDSTVALLYGCFTIMFILTNYSSQEVHLQSKIYQSVVKAYTDMPWNYKPLAYIDDIKSPADLFAWMSRVFVDVTFDEQPTNGAAGYCTAMYQCEQAQGNCNSDSQCAGSLTCGDRTTQQEGVEVNGEYRALEDLVAWCEYAGTPLDLSTPGGQQPCSVDAKVRTGVGQCCTDPDSGLPIQRLGFYTDDSAPVVSSNCPIYMWVKHSCCTRDTVNYQERNETIRQAPPRSATVGNFNRVIGIRLGLKRFQRLENSRDQKWADLFPEKLSGGGVFMDPRKQNSDENTATFFSHANDTVQNYTYTVQGSYYDAGYYTVYIDPADGEDGARRILQQMKRDLWFDLDQAVFTADILVYNGNPDIDAFVHITFIFQFQFAGLAKATQTYDVFNLNFFNVGRTKYRWRLICEAFLLLCVLFFFFLEFTNFRYNPWAYLRKVNHVIDIVSLNMCIVVLVGGWCFQADALFDHFDFADLNSPEDQGGTWSRLSWVAYLFACQRWIVAFNMLMLLFRAISMAARLHINLGLMLRVLDVAMYNLLWFSGMFLMIMMGFGFFAFFTFGSDYKPMSHPLMSLFEVFSMVFGKPIYTDLMAADATMAPIFFYTFYVLFYLVMLNMFVSIIMSGYDIVVDEVEKQLENDAGLANPFRRILYDVKSDFISHFRSHTNVTLQIEASVEQVTQRARDLGHSINLGDFHDQHDHDQHDDHVLHHEPTQFVEEEMEEEPGVDTKKGFPTREFVLMLIFMSNFVLFANFQVRGVATYTMRAATFFPTQDAAWVTDDPKRNMNFGNITSLEDVYLWVLTAIKPMYQNTKCAHWDSATKTGYLSSEGECNSSLPDRKLVQVVNGWNIGFMTKTFVRMTVVPACFELNPEGRWAEGYPMIRKGPAVGPLLDRTCLTSGGEVIDLQGNKYGNWSDPWELGPVFMKGGYVYSLGSTAAECEEIANALLERRVFTKDTAIMVFDWVMYNGNIDMFAYNRIDFTLDNTGSLSVSTWSQAFPMNLAEGGGAGEFRRKLNVALFVVYICFVCYYVFDMARDLRTRYRQQKAKYSRAPACRFIGVFLSDYWNVSDTLSLFISLLEIIIYTWYFAEPFREASGYAFSVDYTKRTPLPATAATRFGMVDNDDPARPLQEDWYTFWKFEVIQNVYFTLLTCAGLNSFFIAIKTVKYAGMLESVKVFSFTLARGKTRITYFSIIILMQMLGFALFVSVVFGPTVGDDSLNNPITAMVTLFNWIVGDVNLEPYLKYNMVMTLMAYVLFMVQFYFISLQLFLATMLNTYAKEMGAKDMKKVTDQRERMKSLRVMQYGTVEEFMADVTLAEPTLLAGDSHEFAKGLNAAWAFKDHLFGHEHTEKEDHERDDHEGADEHAAEDDKHVQFYEFVVASTTPGGRAASFNVAKGHVIIRINGKNEFQTMSSVDELYDLIRRTTRDELSVTFKDRRETDLEFMKLLKNTQDGDIIPASVRNLWVSAGAVSWIHSLAEQEATAEERGFLVHQSTGDTEGKSEGEGESQPGDAQDVQEERDPVATTKFKTKKRLDSLLFSRWVIDEQGRRRPTEHETCPAEGGKTSSKFTNDKSLWREPVGGYARKKREQEAGAHQNDKDYMKARLEKDRVTGEEAWLDILITAIEREMDGKEFSLIPEVLRSNTAHDAAQQNDSGSAGDAGSDEDGMATLRANVSLLLKVLEYKAKRKYYDQLRKESEEHVRHLETQNQYLYDYIWELEKEFGHTLAEIENFKAKKEALLRSVAGVLDKLEYEHILMKPPTPR